MNIIFDDKRQIEERARALRTMLPIASELVDSRWIPKLVDYADECENRDLKLRAVQLLARSWDPQGLPLLSKLLTEEQDATIQLSLVGALAAWNVRDGVKRLVALVDSETMISDRQPLWASVLQTLEEFNDIKSWGFPMTEVKQELERIGDGQARLTVYRQRWKEWFAHNEHRFPDWKPGDPLPEVAAPEKRIPAEKRAEDK